jgi:hypothetical protein
MQEPMTIKSTFSLIIDGNSKIRTIPEEQEHVEHKVHIYIYGAYTTVIYIKKQFDSRGEQQ